MFVLLFITLLLRAAWFVTLGAHLLQGGRDDPLYNRIRVLCSKCGKKHFPVLQILLNLDGTLLIKSRSDLLHDYTYPSFQNVFY